MTIECYTTSCRHHSYHSDDPEDGGPFCYRLECREASLLIGEMRSCRRPNAVAPWRVWTGSRWQNCWTATGASLLAKDLRRLPTSLPGGQVAVSQTSVYGPVYNILPLGAVVSAGAFV